MNIIIYIHDNIPAARFWVNTETQKRSALQRRELFIASSFLVWVQTYGTPALSKPQWPSSGIWSEGYNHWIGLISISLVTPEAFELFDRIKIRSWIFKFDVFFYLSEPLGFFGDREPCRVHQSRRGWNFGWKSSSSWSHCPSVSAGFPTIWKCLGYRKLIGNYQNACDPQVFFLLQLFVGTWLYVITRNF